MNVGVNMATVRAMTDTSQPSQQDILKARIRHDFINHAPTEQSAAVLDRLTELAIEVGDELIELCPNGRELSLAITDLESMLRNAKAAVVRNQ